ncbi:hypothetical protein D6C86_03768, partial [Aureobasidium pullulans]
PLRKSSSPAWLADIHIAHWQTTHELDFVAIYPTHEFQHIIFGVILAYFVKEFVESYFDRRAWCRSWRQLFCLGPNRCRCCRGQASQSHGLRHGWEKVQKPC